MPPALVIVAAVVAGVAAKRGSEQKAKVIERERTIARQQAERERQAGIAEADDFRRRHRRLLATSRANRAGSGVSAAGSPLLVEGALAGEIELGALRARNVRETRKTSLLNQASLLKFQELETRVQGHFDAFNASASTLGAGSGSFGGGFGGGGSSAPAGGPSGGR